MGILWITMKQWSSKKLTHTQFRDILSPSFKKSCNLSLVYSVYTGAYATWLYGDYRTLGSHYQDSYIEPTSIMECQKGFEPCSYQVLLHADPVLQDESLREFSVVCFVCCPVWTSQHCWKRRTMVVLNSSDPTRTWRISACALSKLQFQLGDGQQPNQSWVWWSFGLQTKLIYTNMALPDFASKFIDL